MYYPYDENSEITAKLSSPPESGDYCISNMDFDLDLNRVIVGAIDTEHNLTYYTIKAKPAEQLAAALKDVRTVNETLGQQVTAMTLSGAEKDTLIQQLGREMVQAQLDIAALKGGTGT